MSRWRRVVRRGLLGALAGGVAGLVLVGSLRMLAVDEVNRDAAGSQDPRDTTALGDLEMIEVMRGAAASTLYGSRVGSGVAIEYRSSWAVDRDNVTVLVRGQFDLRDDEGALATLESLRPAPARAAVIHGLLDELPSDSTRADAFLTLLRAALPAEETRLRRDLLIRIGLTHKLGGRDSVARVLLREASSVQAGLPDPVPDEQGGGGFADGLDDIVVTGASTSPFRSRSEYPSTPETLVDPDPGKPWWGGLPWSWFAFIGSVAGAAIAVVFKPVLEALGRHVVLPQLAEALESERLQRALAATGGTGGGPVSALRDGGNGSPPAAPGTPDVNDDQVAGERPTADP